MQPNGNPLSGVLKNEEVSVHSEFRCEVNL